MTKFELYSRTIEPYIVQHNLPTVIAIYYYVYGALLNAFNKGPF